MSRRTKWEDKRWEGALSAANRLLHNNYGLLPEETAKHYHERGDHKPVCDITGVCPDGRRIGVVIGRLREETLVRLLSEDYDEIVHLPFPSDEGTLPNPSSQDHRDRILADPPYYRCFKRNRNGLPFRVEKYASKPWGSLTKGESEELTFEKKVRHYK